MREVDDDAGNKSRQNTPATKQGNRNGQRTPATKQGKMQAKNVGPFPREGPDLLADSKDQFTETVNVGLVGAGVTAGLPVEVTVNV